MSEKIKDWRSRVSKGMLNLEPVASRITQRIEMKLKAQGKSLLNLTPYPEKKLPQHVIKAADLAMGKQSCAPSEGIPELREAIAHTTATELGIRIDPYQQVLVTSGAMHALYIVIHGLLNPGEEVILPVPCYFFGGIIKMAQGKICCIDTAEKESFRWDLDSLERRITPQTKIIIVNTPTNPTGYVATENDLERLVQIANDHNLWIVADESYDKLVYDGRQHTSVLSVPDVKKRTILIRSATKSYAMPGWRIGWIIARSELISHFVKLLEWMTLYLNCVAQKVVAAALSGSNSWLEGIREEFERNRDIICSKINSIPDISVVTPQGGPFIFPNISKLGLSSEKISSRILREYGIPSTPGKAFYANSYIRIPIGGTIDLVNKLGERLETAVREISQQDQKLRKS